MRQSEELPIDPEVLAELEAIDATLAGEAVDPVHAELAELALLLAAGRPQIPAEFARTMDGRVSRRFAPVSLDGGSMATPARRPWWRLGPGMGVAAGVLAALIVAVIIVLPGAGGSSSNSNQYLSLTPPVRHAASTASSSSSSGASAGAGTSTSSAASAPAAPTPEKYGASGKSLPAHSKSASASALAPDTLDQSLAATATTPEAVTPTPNTQGRKTIQSAQLQLLASGARIDTVSQELFNVVGQENGIVNHSSITAGTGNSGFAFFSLKIPSGNLAQTMTQLSELRYASVTSRTDNNQDVQGRYVSEQHQLADAQALRTSLLKQLAAADTETAIASLTAQIHDAESSIATDQAAIRGLNNQVNYSSLSVTINAGSLPIPAGRHTGKSTGFTIGRAAHDAGRVLVVVAGVSLIALAILLPVGLIVALVAWIAYWVRRRGREQALDLA